MYHCNGTKDCRVLEKNTLIDEILGGLENESKEPL